MGWLLPAIGLVGVICVCSGVGSLRGPVLSPLVAELRSVKDAHETIILQHDLRVGQNRHVKGQIRHVKGQIRHVKGQIRHANKRLKEVLRACTAADIDAFSEHQLRVYMEACTHMGVTGRTGTRHPPSLELP